MYILSSFLIIISILIDFFSKIYISNLLDDNETIIFTNYIIFEKISNLLLGIVMVSTLSSYLIRIYAWKIILGEQGIINKFFLFIGIINQPFTFLLYGNFSIIITLVHILLPFAFLPIYSSMQNIDKQIVEASRDLGFGFLMTIFKVIIPLSFPGILAAFLFCFILSSADYVTPQLVGGADGVMIGRVIYDQFGHIGDPPLGSSIAVPEKNKIQNIYSP